MILFHNKINLLMLLNNFSFLMRAIDTFSVPYLKKP